MTAVHASGRLALALLAVLALGGCSGSADDGEPDAAATTSASGSASPTAEPGPDKPVGWWRGQRGAEVDGVRALIPEGYQEAHLREGYAFLGYHDEGLVDWLTMVAPVQVSVAPPEQSAALEPAPADIYRFLKEADPDAVEDLGSVEVEGVPVPVVRTDGDLTLCPQFASAQTCRWNSPERFFVLVPYAGGTLVVEGESPVTAAGRTDVQVERFLGELQDWASTIRLP